MCAASCTKARIPGRQTDTRKAPLAAANPPATHHPGPLAAHTPRAERPPRSQRENTEVRSFAASTPRGSSRATAWRVPAPRRSRLVRSLAGVTEIQELAVAIIVDERLHQISCSEAAPQTRELWGHRGRVGSSVEVIKRSHL